MDSTMTVVGRLGKDPVFRTTKGGKEVANFSVAVDSSNGVTWYQIAAWNKLAVVCAKYLSKGRLIQIEGFMTEQKWISKDGEERVSERLFANWVKFLDKAPKKEDVNIEKAVADAPLAKEVTEDDIPF